MIHANSRPLSTLEWVLLAAAAGAFLLLATYRLQAPGLYADELLFGPATLRALGECDVQGSVSFELGRCAPLYLDPAYLGAAKAWLYVPVFALFEPSPVSVRLPAILASLLGLALVLAWLRREVGTAFAAIVVVVLALDPVYLVHTRIDWGPFVLSNLCKLGILLALACWRDDGAPRLLALAFALALAGMYDKLNFIWTIVAFAVATMASWPRVALAQLRARPHSHAWIVGGFAFLMAITVLALVVPAMRLDFKAMSQELDPWLQWQKLVVYYNETYASSFVRNWITAVPVAAPSWPFRILLGQFALLLLLCAARPWRDADLSRGWRLLVFVSVAIAMFLLQMLLTRQLGGAHHLVALWPLPTVQLVLLAWIGAQVPVDRAWRPQAAVAAAVLVALATVAAAVPRHADMMATWRGEHRFSGRFDPAIARLAQVLRETDAQAIITADWGLHEPLVMLARRGERWKYRPWWPVFTQPYAQEARRNQWLRENFLDRGDSLWITFAPGDDVFPEARQHLPEFVRQWGGCLRPELVITRDDGSPLYQVWRYRGGEPCPVPDLG